MPSIEVGHWIAGESENLSRPQFWVAERRSPGFPDAVLADAGAVVSDPSVRASAIDVAPDFVAGLIESRQILTAFCFQASNYAQVELWLASTHAAADGHGLLRFWLEAVSSGLVNEFKWSMPVDTSALRMPATAVSNVPARRIRHRGRNIAVRERDRQHRLHICCNMFDHRRLQGRSSQIPGLVLVDGLTVLHGERFDFAGLVPTHRYASSNWFIVDRLAASREVLTRFRDKVSEIVQQARSTRDAVAESADDGNALSADAAWLERADRHETDRDPMQTSGLTDIVRARDLVRQAIDTAVASHETSSAAAGEQDLFERPQRLTFDAPWTAETPVPSSFLESMARALIMARHPAVAVNLPDAFADWLEAVKGLDVGSSAFILSEAAQPIYDHCRRYADGTTAVLQGFDGLIDRLVEMAEQLAASAQDGVTLIGACSETDRSAVVEAFDRLAEMETTSWERDRQVLRAGALIRLVAGLPTPDVIDRAVRAALVEDKGVFARLLARSRLSEALRDLAAVAVLDVQGTALSEGRKLFGDVAEQPPGSNTGDIVQTDGRSTGYPFVFDSFLKG
jgi:hypothetical protein